MWISLFKKQSDNEKAPVMDGMIKVTQELKDLLEKSNPDDILDVALWKRVAKNSGKPYLSGQISEHKERDTTKPMEKKEYKGHPGKSQDDLPF